MLYRKPAQRLDVSISPDQRRYVPGQKVKLSLLTTDEKVDEIIDKCSRGELSNGVR